MDNRLQTFMELSAAPELEGLCADPRAAWVWSADGTRILWANAAGASFFSVRNWSGLSQLDGLSRSPARPHIARIATEGATDRATIDRLRFYRGLRVMLLTCQCRRINLAGGQDAALIVCGDKGLEFGKDPLGAFLHLICDEDHTAFLLKEGNLSKTDGKLEGTPEWLELPDGQMGLFGPIALGKDLHEGAVAQVSSKSRIIVLENLPLATDDLAASQDGVGDDANGLADADHNVSVERTETPTVLAAPAASDDADTDHEIADETIIPSEDSGDLSPSDDQPVALNADGVSEQDAGDGEDQGSQWTRAQDLAESPVDDAGGFGDEEDDGLGPDGSEPAEAGILNVPPLARARGTAATSEANDFHFVYRRRPVRFAWKMDIDQRFTFISDEFAETLGPEAADVVGMTWSEVAEQFDLDITGSISRALQRRDTWSGKTVDWPVTGEALRVPVDMAALPAFDRDREFEGYRGFGVCRTADAIDDPLAPLMTERLSTIGHDNQEPSLSEPSLEADDETREEIAGETGENEELAKEAAPLPEEGLSEPFGDHAENSDSSVDENLSAPDDSDETDVLTEGTSDLPEEPVEEQTVQDNSGETGVEATAPSSVTIDLTPAPKAPLEGKTLLGASTAALLGSLPFGKRFAANKPEIAVTPNLPANEAKTSEAGDKSGEPNGDEADAAIAAALDQAADRSEELTGISGNAPLHPQEIETAVKSLARDFGRKSKPDQNPTPTEDAHASPAIQDKTASALATTDGSDDDGQIDLEDLVNEAEAASGAETDKSVTDVVETASEETNDEVPDEVADGALLDTVSDHADDEREFFEETVAFREEETGTSAPQLSIVEGQNDNTVPDGAAEVVEHRDFGDDGKVVSINRKPHLVPVDTSRLSKPEKAAFRKIAEALGARLEGDMDDGDLDEELNRELEKVDPLPEAGPIDPGLLDRLPIGIAIAHDRDVLYANDTLLDLLGYGSLKALAEAGGLEAVFVEEEDEPLPDADGMEGTVDDTLKVRVAGGGVRCVDARMHSVPWNGGRGLMISFTERTPAAPRKDAAKTVAEFEAPKSDALKQAEDRIAELDTILETATDGVLVLDRHGSITKVNRSAEALFGASRSDMEGAPLTDFLAPESHRAAADYLDGLSRNGVASILNDGREVLGRVASGGLIPLFMTIGRVSSPSDDAKFCAVLRDITQWKTAEEELTQAKRQAENASSQKSDFLAKISHEIRTPLNAIIGFSEVMMEERFGAIGNERYKEYLRDIRTSGSHIMSLINDLLDLSKIEAGKMDLRFSAVSANDVINECVALMQPQANRERVIIRASLPDSVPSVVADQRSLRQIVLNLLSNAIKFNKSGGQVIVSSSLEDSGEVVLRVRDTGTGMSAKDLAAALEPFRQVHTARHGGGTGLGLPLTKALVEANRAGFHIDSTPDQGTLVEIRFPSQRVLAE
ncbi:ATP-binding protein [Roseibium sp.]|uniref:PAS domain-containing sensor histidine kinase n=1 Tax=Roseibium sp. TaxID=1936156 RepID=UPI003A97ED16